MNKLQEYMKANHSMKSFAHVPQEKKQLNLITKTINGKRFYVLPTALFTILKTELDKINNIVMQEGSLYSEKWGVAGRVDCIAEYDGKLSVIDFKTSTKDKKEEWVENYFIQTSAYCEMFEEQYGISIDQIVILIVTEAGGTQTFVKNKKDYLPLLKPAIEEFHKKFKEDGKTN